MKFFIWRIRFVLIMAPRKVFKIPELWQYWCFDCYERDPSQTPKQAANELTCWARK